MAVLHSENGALLVHDPEINDVVDGTGHEELVVDHVDGVTAVLFIFVEEL